MTDPQGLAPFAQRVPIRAGDKGTYDTLRLAAELVGQSLMDPLYPVWVRRKILAETGIDPRDVPAVFRAIHDYVKANVGYQPDALVLGDKSVMDYVQSPHWTLFLEGFGDCLSHASAVDSFSVALGHGAGYRTLKADASDPSRFSHVYPILGYKDPVTGSDVWIPADTTLLPDAFGLDPENIARYSPQDIIIAPAL